MNNLEFLIKLNDMLSPAMKQAAALTDTEAAKIVNDFRRMEQQMDHVEVKAGKLGGVLKTAFAMAGGNLIASAFTGTTEWLHAAIEKAETKHQAIAQINASLVSTKGAAGLNFEDVENSAKKISSASQFGTNDLLKMQSVLLTFPSITKNTFDTASQAITNMSVKMGQDLQSSAVQVGKALQDPERGITALRRVGVNFNEAQSDSIKKLVAEGKIQEAQTRILTELNNEFGGSAKAAFDADPLIKLRKTMTTIQTGVGDVLLALVKQLASAFNTVVNAIKDVVHWMGEHKTAMIIVTGVLGFLTTTLIIHNTWQKIKVFWDNQMTMASMRLMWATIKTNLAFLANPVFWLIAGIVALVTVIAVAVIAFKGWGEAWKHVVNGSKLIFKGFVEGLKWDFNTVVDGIMIGLDKIMQGWYSFKKSVGMGNDTENQIMIAGLNTDVQNREKNILQGSANVANIFKQAGSEFIAADKSIVYDKEGVAKAKHGVKQFFGLGEHGVDPTTANAANNLASAGDKDAKKEKHAKASAINGGGQRSIVINIGKQIEKIEQHIVGGSKEVANEIETAVAEAMRRVLFSVNGMANN